jgi:hypothetical protein
MPSLSTYEDASSQFAKREKIAAPLVKAIGTFFAVTSLRVGVTFSALPHLLPFIILKENVHYVAVLISGHHGPVVFVFGDGKDMDSDLACLRPPPCLQ